MLRRDANRPPGYRLLASLRHLPALRRRRTKSSMDSACCRTARCEVGLSGVRGTQSTSGRRPAPGFWASSQTRSRAVDARNCEQKHETSTRCQARTRETAAHPSRSNVARYSYESRLEQQREKSPPDGETAQVECPQRATAPREGARARQQRAASAPWKRPSLERRHEYAALR